MIQRRWVRYLRGTRRRSVTLLEVVLALGLLGTVSAMTFWFYAESLATNREGTEVARKLRLSRSVLNRITREIRQSASITADNRVGVRGEAERLWLSSYRVPTRSVSRQRVRIGDIAVAEYDLTKVEYKIVRHPEIEHPDGYEFPLGLARVEIRVPRPAQTVEEDGEGDGEDGDAALDPENIDMVDINALIDGGDQEGRSGTGGATLGPEIQWDELYAPEIRYLRFCFYDGTKWWDTWDVSGDTPLPQLVMVTVGFEPQPPFGETQLGLGETNEEFCTCLNEDPVDCEPLAPDQLSTVVRLPQSDPLFRSRIARETQSFMEELGEGSDEEEGEGQ